MESVITYNQQGQATGFSGPDAVECFRAACLASSLPLYASGIRFAGTMSATQALKECSKYTGRRYKRGEFERARSDLKVWIETMKSALPTETR